MQVVPQCASMVINKVSVQKTYGTAAKLPVTFVAGVCLYFFSEIVLGVYCVSYFLVSIKMQFSEARPKRRVRLGGFDEKLGYSHALQFYSLPPTENITLNEFEELATERLKGTRSRNRRETRWCLGNKI